MRSRRLIFALIAALLVLAGCGGDDDSGGGGGDEVTAEEGGGEESEESASGGTTGTCDGLAISGASPGNDGFQASSAVAASLMDGAAYTLYVADFDLDVDSFTSFSSPEVPADGTMFTIAVTIFNAEEDQIQPIEAGTEIAYSSEFGVLTFTVMANDGEEFFGNNTGAEGSVTVTAVGDTFCGTITYSDGEKSVSGTFEAPAKGV